ncbi:MAG: PAS domain S-box protein [Bacteroidetes bacterium]|nr:PAS domain S-box protein [Bacteroidota bacterium]
MKRLLLSIPPKYVILVTLLAAALMFGSAIVELNESRSEFIHVLREHALSVSETIANSSSNIVSSGDEIEAQMADRLLNNAMLIARLDSLRPVTSAELRSIASENHIFRINIFDGKGRRILSNHPPDPHQQTLRPKHTPGEFIGPILRGEERTLVIGFKQARYEEGERFAVAVRRTRPGGGAIVLNIDAAELQEFRKRTGIGKMVSDLGNDEGIEFVVLQDREGILAASGQVRDMTAIDEDSAVVAALERDSVVLRETEFLGRSVFEVVRRLTVDDATVGVIRVGLSMDEVRTIEDRMQRRLLVMTIVLAILSLVIGAFILLSRNIRIVSERFAEHQMMTAGILEQMHDAVITLNGIGVITIMNGKAEELFGRTAQDSIGRSVDDLSGSRLSIVKRFLAEPRTAFEAEMESAEENGPRRSLLVARSITHRTDGAVETITFVIRDLTEMKRLQQEMQRKDKLTAMGELASGVAHEIRNPLNAISMIVQRFEREFTPKKGVKEYTELTGVLKSESSRINGIIMQFLSFARPKPVRKREVRLDEFAGYVASVFRSQAEERSVGFMVDASPVHCSMDDEQMTQAVLNLLQNALDATPRNGTIQLSMHRSESGIRITVADSGPGIEDTAKNKIFDLYFTTKSSGTGMGLAIVQQIVTQHAGTITVTDRSGGGAEFLIDLPLL